MYNISQYLFLITCHIVVLKSKNIAIWYLHIIDTVDSFAFSFANGIW